MRWRGKGRDRTEIRTLALVGSISRDALEDCVGLDKGRRGGRNVELENLMITVVRG